MKIIFNLLNIKNVGNLIRYFIPISIIGSIISLIFGLYHAFYASPIDYQQLETVRIMYIHVPAAWMSLLIYSVMAICSIFYIIYKNPLLHLIAKINAPIGAIFTAITLITGSLWGKPIWGAYWVWDARLTSELILLFFYLGYISFVNSVDDNQKSATPAAFIAIIGFINVPIVKFSVDFWNSLHQGASILKSGGPSIHPSMLVPLLTMFIFNLFYYILIFCLKLQAELNINKAKSIRVKRI